MLSHRKAGMTEAKKKELMIKAMREKAQEKATMKRVFVYSGDHEKLVKIIRKKRLNRINPEDLPF